MSISYRAIPEVVILGLVNNELPRRTRVAAYTIITRDAEILLCRMSASTDDPGKWTLPGGGINFGEDPAAAAVREAHEETGFDVGLDRVIGIFSDAFDSAQASHHNIGIIYAAKIVGGELRNEIDGSTDGCEWIPLAHVDGLPLVPVAKLGARLAVTSRSPSPSTPGIHR